MLSLESKLGTIDLIIKVRNLGNNWYDLFMIPFPDKKYSIIYADPPWQYDRNGNHSAESVYDVMSIDEIKSLPVAEISAEQSHLYLWTTNPFLQEGFRGCTEHIIFGVKGKKLCENNETRNIIIDRATKHSEKPIDVKKIIVECSGDLPRIELFSRPKYDLLYDETNDGWDCWGNEV